MNNYVNFELAKLLKEKGFNIPCPKIYNTLGDLWNAHYTTMKNSDVDSGAKCTAPTIADIIMWLYEKYEIWINVWMMDKNEFYWGIDTNEEEFTSDNINFISPTEAYEAAIEYILTNLIK